MLGERIFDLAALRWPVSPSCNQWPTSQTHRIEKRRQDPMSRACWETWLGYFVLSLPWTSLGQITVTGDERERSLRAVPIAKATQHIPGRMTADTQVRPLFVFGTDSRSRGPVTGAPCHFDGVCIPSVPVAEVTSTRPAQ